MAKDRSTSKTPPVPGRGAPAVAVISLGCAKNLVDSEKMCGLLAEAGFLVGSGIEEADLVLINTCGFLASARDEGRAAIEEAAEVAARTGARIVVAGCMVQHAGEQVQEMGVVHAAVALGERDRIAEICRAVLAEKIERDREEIRPFTAVPDDAGRLLLTPRHAAYLRITEGCDNCCAYCAIPAIRGPLRSKPIDVLLDETDGLLAGGARELVLIGQDTTAWGMDRFARPSLERLLDPLIEAVGPDRWLRVLYTHPAHWSEAVIDRFAAGGPLLPYVDLPIQHCDADILARMDRKTAPVEIERLIGRLRERIPGLALRTTLIVGLPGETSAAFGRLVRFVQRHAFEHLGVFAYSPEPGTAAAAMKRQVRPETKAARLAELMAVQQEIAFARARRRVDDAETAALLVDGAGGRGQWRGRFAHQAPDVDGVTYVLADRLEAGSFLDATVVGAEEYDLVAEPAGGGAGR